MNVQLDGRYIRFVAVTKEDREALQRIDQFVIESIKYEELRSPFSAAVTFVLEEDADKGGLVKRFGTEVKRISNEAFWAPV
jgi:hypothetical protein